MTCFGKWKLARQNDFSRCDVFEVRYMYCLAELSVSFPAVLVSEEENDERK